MQKPPKISIIIPSLNQGRFIKDTIKSIISQDYKDLEFFIIDGGSTDNTIDIIKEHESEIDWWISEKDKNQADAINKGFQKASGEIVCWVNSDDILLPNCLHIVSKTFIECNKPDIIHSDLVYIDKNNNIIKMIKLPKQTNFFMKRGKWSVSQPAVFYKASKINSIGYLNTEYRLSMDVDLWVRLLKSGSNIVHISKYLGAFRWHEHSLTTNSIIKKGHKNEENPETMRILSNAYPSTSPRSRKIWRFLWKFFQIFNFNYLISYFHTLKLKGKHWRKVFN